MFVGLSSVSSVRARGERERVGVERDLEQREIAVGLHEAHEEEVAGPVERDVEQPRLSVGRDLAREVGDWRRIAAGHGYPDEWSRDTRANVHVLRARTLGDARRVLEGDQRHETDRDAVEASLDRAAPRR